MSAVVVIHRVQEAKKKKSKLDGVTTNIKREKPTYVIRREDGHAEIVEERRAVRGSKRAQKAVDLGRDAPTVQGVLHKKAIDWLGATVHHDRWVKLDPSAGTLSYWTQEPGSRDAIARMHACVLGGRPKREFPLQDVMSVESNPHHLQILIALCKRGQVKEKSHVLDFRAKTNQDFQRWADALRPYGRQKKSDSSLVIPTPSRSSTKDSGSLRLPPENSVFTVADEESFRAAKVAIAQELDQFLYESEEERARLFKDLCLLHHPDKNGSSEESVSIFQYLQEQKSRFLPSLTPKSCPVASNATQGTTNATQGTTNGSSTTAQQGESPVDPWYSSAYTASRRASQENSLQKQQIRKGASREFSGNIDQQQYHHQQGYEPRQQQQQQKQQWEPSPEEYNDVEFKRNEDVAATDGAQMDGDYVPSDDDNTIVPPGINCSDQPGLFSGGVGLGVGSSDVEELSKDLQNPVQPPHNLPQREVPAMSFNSPGVSGPLLGGTPFKTDRLLVSVQRERTRSDHRVEHSDPEQRERSSSKEHPWQHSMDKSPLLLRGRSRSGSGDHTWQEGLARSGFQSHAARQTAGDTSLSEGGATVQMHNYVEL